MSCALSEIAGQSLSCVALPKPQMKLDTLTGTPLIVFGYVQN